MRFRAIVCTAFVCLTAVYGFERRNYAASVASYNSYKEFIRGVEEYNNQRYETAVESFRRSLMFDAGDELVRSWLGKALYEGGYRDAALNEWENIERMGLAGPLLASRIARISADPAALALSVKLPDFVYLKAFSGTKDFFSHIMQPIDVLVDGANRIYMLDYADNALAIFNANGVLMKKITAGKKPFYRPKAIALDRGGNIYIADSGNDTVCKFDDRGSFVLAVGGTGYGEGKLACPSGVAVDAEGKIYVSDTANNRVCVFSVEGEYLLSFGSLGSDEGKFYRPSGIAVDNAHIYVADSGNMRVCVFDRYGNFRQAITNMNFHHPRYVRLSRDGDLFITDEKRIFCRDQRTSEIVGFPNSKKYTAAPMGIDEGDDGTLYIADAIMPKIDCYIQKERYYANLDVTVRRTFIATSSRAEGSDAEKRRLVHLVTVRESDGTPVRGLTAKNFTATEVGRSNPRIGMFTDHEELKRVRFVFLIDNSAAAKGLEKRIRDEIHGFTAHLTNDDAALAVHYNDRLRVIGEYDARNLRIEKNATSFSFGGSTRAFGNAFSEAVRRTFRSFSPTAIIIIAADGLTDASFPERTVEECALYARNNLLPVTVVHMRGEKDAFLAGIASKTGGHYLSAKRSIDYTAEISYLKRYDRGAYYLSYQTFFFELDQYKYREFSLQVKYRDRFGEDRTGYLIPKAMRKYPVPVVESGAKGGGGGGGGH
ncbi:MAG: 6-bladed beta-propeller [Spirochaetota bacterium]